MRTPTSEQQQMDNFTISDQYGEYSTLCGEDGKPVVLGRGGFGITICAFKLRRLGEVEIRDDFALKILRYSATEDPKRRSRILKEILALRDLQHPNLASYKDCGEDEGCVFLVMELCRGGDLAALAARVGALPERFALQVVLQVCAGLDEAHRKGYFHRDLKPTNILISEELPADAGFPWLEDRLATGHLRFKVVDFGLAGRFESEVRGGGFMGSPMFASPEQVREQKLDSRSDIYSLGMTLWYLATGKGPLLNANGLPVADAREAMRCHTSPSQHDLAFPEHFSEGFRSLLGRMIRKAPDERFRSAQELTDAIRRQIEAMPAPPAQPAGMPLPKAPLATVATWGTGTFAEYYHVLKQVGRRSIGTFYQARQKASGNTVGFTAWVAANSPNAASEKLIGQHLDRLKSATNDPVAPKVLTRIVDWLRTTDEWCVAEEWSEGEKLDSFVSLRGRSIPLEDAARLLWPLAEACDYLNKQGFDSALLSVDEIRLLSPRAEPDWIGQPIDEWGDWTIRLSALSIPQELAGESRGPGAVESSTTSRFDGCDAGKLRLNKSFCRLLYRLIEGADAAVAADWDAQAFTAAGKLGAESNALLRDYICGVFADDPMLDILKRVCSHERLAGIPGRADIAAPSAPPTRAMPAGTVAPPGSLPAPPDSSTSRGAPTSTVMPPGNQSSTVRSSVSGSRLPRKSEPIFDVAPANQVEVAQLVPGRPGFVRSPYGVRREQQVPGLEWRENAQVKCQATGRPFQLPAEMPPLEAILIGERFDAVLTPYVDPPREIAVPLGKWKAGAEFTCSLTERLLRQPQQLPAAIATAIEDRPGIVRSPYADQPEIEVKVESWKPGELLVCPASDQMFALPAVLPPLLAMPGEAPGSYTSPYAPGQPFDLPAPKCVPGHRFPCPWTAQPLVLPSSLPGHWQFEGNVRQADAPEARSPYFEIESEGWQPLGAADWRPGATIQCRGTGRPFTLPATLPVLRVKAGPNPFSILSPFPPHEAIRVSAQDWIAGAEVTVSLNAETPCRIALPGELPVLDRVEIAELDSVPQGRLAQARGSIGVIRSPFTEDGEWIEIPGQKWLPGVRAICPATSCPFWLPAELPPLEARLGHDLGSVHSPYTDDLVKIAELDWIAGRPVPCPQTRMPFLLPQNLPWLEGGVADSRPGWVESPFDRGSAYLVEYAEWKPGGILECPTTERKFALPQSVPEWIPEAGLDETNPGMARDPNGPGNWFKVPGTDWEAGATIHCPETQTKLTLPAELPALKATLVEGRPGYVQTPYTAEPEQVRIHSSKWRGGSLVECPATKRPLRLPGSLPPLVSSFPIPRKFLIPAAAVAILAAVGFLVAMLFRGGPSWAVTTFTYLIPPISPPPPPDDTKSNSKGTAPTPQPDRGTITEAAWPDTIVIKNGFFPREAKVFLRLQDETAVEQLKIVPYSGSIERTIALREALNKVKNIGAQKTLALSFEASGYRTEPIPISPGQTYLDQQITLKRLKGTVSWPVKDPFYLSFYQKIRFVPQGESKRESDKEDYSELFGKGSFELPTGKYAVSLVGKTNLAKDWRQDKVAVTVEDRSLYPSATASGASRELNIEEGKNTEIANLPQSVHRLLAGAGSYKWGGMKSLVSNKKIAFDVGKEPAEYDLEYWSPCVLKFDDDFTGGELIDENNLLSCGADRFLDALVTWVIQEEFKLGKVKNWHETKSYPEGAKILAELSATLQPPSKLSGLTEKGIKDSRMEIFDLEERAWKLANTLGITPRIMVQDARLNWVQEGDYPEFHDWFVQLKKSMLKNSWSSASFSIASERLTSAVLKNMDSLAQPLAVGSHKGVPGYFVKQSFVVTDVYENGQIRLRFEPVGIRVPYVGERNRDNYMRANLVQKQSNSKTSYDFQGVFDGDPDKDISRRISLTPIEN